MTSISPEAGGSVDISPQVVEDVASVMLACGLCDGTGIDPAPPEAPCRRCGGDNFAERQAGHMLRALRSALTAAQETNKRLNRRCQEAEAALPDYRKLLAVPPNGDGVRFVSGSLGRALAVTMCAKQEKRIAELESSLTAREQLLERAARQFRQGNDVTSTSMLAEEILKASKGAA